MNCLVKGRLNVGIASVNITPPLGIEIAGYCFGPSVGVLDELYAKALVLESDGAPESRIVIVTTDLIGFGFDITERIRAGIKKEIGVTKDHLLLCGSHTHSGPSTSDKSMAWTKVDEDYKTCLAKKVVGVAAWAVRELAPANIGFGKGHVDTISNNRVYRWKYKEDRSIDPEVGVIRIDDQEGFMKAILMNFACHPTSLHSYRNFISADYPGFARRTIEKVKGDIFVAFTLGTAGDITPDPWEYLYYGLPENLAFSERNGTILGSEVLRVAEQIKTVPDVNLWAKTQTVKLPLGPLPDKEFTLNMRKEALTRLEKAKDLPDEPPKRDDPRGSQGRPRVSLRHQATANTQLMIEWADNVLTELEKGQPKKYRSMEIQAIGINDLVFVTMPAEVFHEIGLAIKKQSTYDHTYIVTCANGSVGYIPTKKAFEIEYPYMVTMTLGGYPYSAEVEQVTVDAAVNLILSAEETS